jgi:hypothetical protein
MKWDVEHRTRAETVRITGKRALVELSHDGIRGPGVFLHGTIRRKWATWKRKKEDMITERKWRVSSSSPSEGSLEVDSESRKGEFRRTAGGTVPGLLGFSLGAHMIGHPHERRQTPFGGDDGPTCCREASIPSLEENRGTSARTKDFDFQGLREQPAEQSSATGA